MKKKSKENIAAIKDLAKTPRGRGIIFFAAYLIFFLAVILVIRLSSRGEVIGSGYEKGNPFKFSINNILGKNYKFNYNINIDENSMIYSGSKNGNYELFSLNKNNSNTDYYRNGDNFLVNSNGMWIKSDDPYLYKDFLDIDKISKLITKGSFSSKTEYDSGKRTYNFLVSTASITKAFEGVDADISEVPNEMVISTDENGYVNLIAFNLTSYCSFKHICNSSMKIILQYNDYGNVKEIISPLS